MVEVREESLGKFPKNKDGGPGKGVAGGGMKFGESVGTIPKKTHKNGEKHLWNPNRQKNNQFVVS